MTATHHGFAFAWNNGGHSEGGRAMTAITKYYPREKFARNRSYPAFGNSSIDHNMGNGDPEDGDLEGGINLGFDWKDVIDEEAAWSVTVSNELAKEADDRGRDAAPLPEVQAAPGDTVRWTTSTGDSGTAVTDAAGLVTVPRVRILPGKATVLTLSK